MCLQLFGQETYQQRMFQSQMETVFNKQRWVLILFYSASEICPLGERKESRDKSFQFLLQKLIEYQVTLIRGRDRPA